MSDFYRVIVYLALFSPSVSALPTVTWFNLILSANLQKYEDFDEISKYAFICPGVFRGEIRRKEGVYHTLKKIKGQLSLSRLLGAKRLQPKK